MRCSHLFSGIFLPVLGQLRLDGTRKVYFQVISQFKKIYGQVGNFFQNPFSLALGYVG
jgi:hypothetical protein